MSQTITYDPANDPDAIDYEEERDAESLAIGEQLEEAQNQLLAGKYQSAEELEKAYIELQSKFSAGERGSVDEDSEEDSDAETDTEEIELDESSESAVAEYIKDIVNEFRTNGGFSEETLAELNSIDPTELAQAMLEYGPKEGEAEQSQEQTVLSENDVAALQNMVGGAEAYTGMVQWAAENFSQPEQDAYNRVMNSGNPEAIFFAMKSLQFAAEANMPREGRMVQGRSSSNNGSVYRSQAELVRDQSDPRYDRDPAFRKEVFAKLERSPDLM